MVKTNAKKHQARAERLRGLPKSERLVKSALIKKKEGRVLDSAEKHALKMSSEYGEIMRLWEVLRVSTGPANSETGEVKRDTAEKDVVQLKRDRYAHKYPTVDRLLKIIEPKVDTYMKTPRTSRVIQSMIKYASVPQLERILFLISQRVCIVCHRRIRHFVVVALLRHAPHSLFDRVLALIMSGVPTLIRTAFGIEVLHAAYSSSLWKEEVSELCVSLRPHLATLCTTREGAPLASLAFALTEPMKRKEVLRAYSMQLGILSASKYSAPVIARLFDLVYNAKLLRKYVVDDMEAHILQVINSPFGHQIFMHLLTPSRERKEKFLLPNWFQHNLFSKENVRWNRHTWLTHDFEEKEVETCSKSAVQSHLAVLPSIVKKFVEVATVKAADTADASGSGTSVGLNRHYAGLIAREILHVNSTEPDYEKALQLSAADVCVLEKLAHSQGRKRERVEEEKTDAAAKGREGKAKTRKVEGPGVGVSNTSRGATLSEETKGGAATRKSKMLKEGGKPGDGKTKKKPKK
uniref:Putative RNA-binding protein n=1 Tax=Trypanosoma vivax (strain Y486) TaxID=1055687 RepID=G0TSR6_TRYVY|nr:putative RNA-binding protein, fragment [Trypanosoma vivax Y486]